jgi:hypothetical protein
MDGIATVIAEKTGINRKDTTQENYIERCNPRMQRCLNIDDLVEFGGCLMPRNKQMMYKPGRLGLSHL